MGSLLGNGTVADRGTHPAQRARVLKATAELVCEDGVEALTVARIVQRSGVSTRAFNRLFDSAGECFLAAVEDALAIASELACAAGAEHVDWVQRLRAGLLAVLGLFDSEPALARLCVVHAPLAGGRARSRFREVVQQAASAIDEAAPPNAPGRGQPATAHSIVGGVLETVHAHLHDSPGRPLSPLAESLVSIIVQPYLNRRPA